MSHSSFYLLSALSILTCFLQVDAGFSDYLTTFSSYFTSPDSETALKDVLTQRVPYEVSVADEKFISEAAKLTGVALSELDSCQQRVVLKLRSDCDKMNDEQLAKMAVHLLNCQSYVEGRRLFPCTDDMSIKACTTEMDSDTWTSYHLMSNRAKAVCYSIRQMQFRGLAEHTVNSLMEASQNQLRTMRDIAESQDQLKEVAETTLVSLAKGHETLTNQQKDIQKAQFHGQLVLEDNIKKLAREKQLIADTHNRLVDMTLKIQKELELSSSKLEQQAGESRENHQQLLDDLIAIQSRTQVIFQRIDDSSRLLLEQNEYFRNQYQETLNNLAEVNRTVHSLVVLVGGTRQALEEKLAWLSTALGGTDLAVERLYLILWHSAFMMISMLTSSFLSARLTTRLVVATAPVLNLTLGLWQNEKVMGPVGLAGTIMAFVVAQMLLLSAISFKRSMKGAIGWKKAESPFKEVPTSTKILPEEDSDLDETDDFSMNEFGSPTPPLSRSGFYTPKPRARSRTPLHINGSFKGVCHAKTRVGTPCKLSSLPGRDYCHRHQGGDSVMG